MLDKLRATVSIPWPMLLIIMGVTSTGGGFASSWANEIEAIKEVGDLKTRITVVENEVKHIVKQVDKISDSVESTGKGTAAILAILKERDE